MRPTLRTIFGFVGATLAPQYFLFNTSIKHHLVGQMHDLAWYTLLVSMALTLLCLVPTHLILQRRGAVRARDYLWMAAKSGMLAGMLVAIAVAGFAWYMGVPGSLRPETPVAIGFLGALLMAMLGLMFWTIAQPDLNRRVQ